MKMEIKDESQFVKNWYDDDYPEQMVRDKIGRIKSWQVTKSKWLDNDSIQFEYMINADLSNTSVLTKEDILKLFHWKSFERSIDGLYVKYEIDESWFVVAPKKRRRKVVELPAESTTDDSKTNVEELVDNIEELADGSNDVNINHIEQTVDDEDDFDNVVGNLELEDSMLSEESDEDDEDTEELDEDDEI